MPQQTTEKKLRILGSVFGTTNYEEIIALNPDIPNRWQSNLPDTAINTLEQVFGTSNILDALNHYPDILEQWVINAAVEEEQKRYLEKQAFLQEQQEERDRWHAIIQNQRKSSNNTGKHSSFSTEITQPISLGTSSSAVDVGLLIPLIDSAFGDETKIDNHPLDSPPHEKDQFSIEDFQPIKRQK